MEPRLGPGSVTDITAAKKTSVTKLLERGEGSSSRGELNCKRARIRGSGGEKARVKEKIECEEGEMIWCVKKVETEIDGSVKTEQEEAKRKGGGQKL